DFRPRMGISAGIRQPRNRGTDNIDDTEDCRTLLFGVFDGYQRISRLPTLGNSDNNVFVSDNGISIAELGSILHLHVDTAKLFNDIFSQQSGVPARSTSHNNNAIGS